MKNYYIAIASMLHFSATSYEDFCIWKRIHKIIILPQGHDRLSPVLHNKFRHLPISRSLWWDYNVYFLKTASMSILPFLVVELPPKAVLVRILGLTPPLDCTKGGNFWASCTSKNRCIVLKHWKVPVLSKEKLNASLLCPVTDDLLTLCLQSVGVLIRVHVFEIRPTSLHSKSFPFEIQSLI